MRLARRTHWRLRLAGNVVSLSLLVWWYFGSGGRWAFAAGVALSLATVFPYIEADIQYDRERKLRRGQARTR